MEDLVHKLSQANVLTRHLLQEVFISAKRSEASTNNSELWDKISQIIWLHMQSGILKIDDQLLCATCFYTVISLTGREQFYLNEIVQMIQSELNLRKNDVLINSKTTLVVSLMYGIFQSSFLITTNKDDACVITLLELAIDLLIQLAYDYSRNTLIVFKIISTMKKVCRTQWQNCIFTPSNQTKLLNLVNHNWENPITGVRDFNKIIFQSLIYLMDETNYHILLKEINSFYWNKAKYLMLSEMIQQYYKNILDLVDQSNWLTGLSNSLQKPGLVSAGTDMYCAVLNRLNSEDQWIEMFLPTMEKVFNSESTKAIENFINYWCLATFKKFPAIIKVFENIFENTYDLNKKMYNGLHILKQGNRLGIVSRSWNSTEDYKLLESMVFQGIEHGNEYVRMAAFDIVCEFQGKTMPSEVEFDLVLNYIKNNINSDCTVLRLGMLKSLKNFLLQTHNALVINSRMGQVDSQNLRSFLKALQEVVIFNLNIKGNYQRKITSVKLCDIIWECSMIDAPKNKKSDVSPSLVSHYQMQHIELTFMKMLIENEQWFLSDDVFVRKLISFLQDPSDDIRENIVNLLINYYSSVFKETELINYVLEQALKSIGGKFFYEISCGQSMFKLIVNILLKERRTKEFGESTFQAVEDVFTFAFNELIKEHNLNRDILESIECGKQLHSFMDILLVVLDVCHRRKYKIKISEKEILELLKCLEDISNHFALEENSSSSDFSKMSDMVQQIICNSGFTSKEDEDVTKISGIHQMVLNCIWLNVKACCDLASLMIRHCDQVTDIEKFLLIITRVLESSRHKGAIESAGAALGQAIQYLTSLRDEADISKIPHTLLKSKLKELIMEASKMASITRRGAGLSIMVHRIVSSDMKKGKPLFHYFITMILDTCSDSEDLPTDLDVDTDIDNEKDLPKAIYIHFLTRIVVDSSIASDVMYYSPQLAKLAFDNLTSSHWQIRNAALQLYGALVPKLLGQKKGSGSGEESIATVACDELRLHSPKLWIYINAQVGNVNTSDKVLSHSVLIPILNMLANSARRYNLSNDPTKHESSESTLLRSLIELLDSPVFTVRRLSAKSIFNIFAFDQIYDAVIQHDFVSENFLHGVLVLIGHCFKHDDGTYTLHYTQFINLRQIVSKKLHESSHSYLCKELYESIFTDNETDPTMVIVQDTLAELDSNVHAPGIFNWAYARIKKNIRNTSWNEIPNIVNMLLSRNELEFCCEILHEKLQFRKEVIPMQILQQTAELLMACEYKFNSSTLWRILYEISQQIELNCYTDALLEGVKTYGNSYKLRFMLPLLAKTLSTRLDNNNLEYLSKVILSLCDPQTVDAEMRYIAALSNNELATAFNSLSDGIKISTITSAVILLQDEDEDVRNLSTIFYKNIAKGSILQHPYFCMQKLLDSEFLHSALREPKSGIQILSTGLLTILSKSSSQNPSDNYNPFANDSRNIYIEVDIIQQLIKLIK